MKLRNSASNALWIMGGRLFHKILIFLVGIALARYLGAKDYGLLQYAGAYVVFFAGVCELGLRSVVARQLVERPQDAAQILGSAAGARLAAGFVCAGLATAAVAITEAGQPLTVWITFLCSVSLLPRGFDILRQWFQVRLQAKYAAMASAISCSIAGGIKLVLILLKRDITWFAAATAVEFVLLAMILLAGYRKQGGRKLRFSPKEAAGLVKAGQGFWISGLMVAVYAAADKLMLGKMLSQETVACYALAVGLCSAWGFLPEALIEGLQPAILEAYTRDRQLYLRKNRQLYALIFYGALGVSLVMCLLADPLVRILYGDEYALAADALRIVVWYTAFSYLGGARDAWVVCEGVQKHLKYIYIGAALINVALNGAMIPLWGIRGAAVASLLTQMATVTLLPALIPALRPNGKLMLEAILLHRLGKKEKG